MSKLKMVLNQDITCQECGFVMHDFDMELLGTKKCLGCNEIIAFEKKPTSHPIPKVNPQVVAGESKSIPPVIAKANPQIVSRKAYDGPVTIKGRKDITCPYCGFMTHDFDMEQLGKKKCLGCKRKISGESKPTSSDIPKTNPLPVSIERKPTQSVQKPTPLMVSLENKSAIPQTPRENPLLVSCVSCSHQFSKRALQCPKCGWRPLAICKVCYKKIPHDSMSCVGTPRDVAC